MDKRELGRSGLMVPNLCFGGNVFGWSADEARSFELLDALVAAGLTFIDTADVYSAWVPGHQGGESEAILGRWLKARGEPRAHDHRHQGRDEDGRRPRGPQARLISASRSRTRCAASRPTTSISTSRMSTIKTSARRTLGAYADLIKAGKVRAIGASNYTGAAPQARRSISARARGLPRYESVQPEYNLMTRHVFEGELEAVCRAGADRRHQLLQPRVRVSHRQVP